MSATNKPKAAPAEPSSIQPEKHPMPAFSTSGAMLMLWDKARGKMNLEEFEWLADGAAGRIQSEANALKAVLESTGCLVSGDDGGVGSFLSARSSSNLFFNLQHQLDTIAGLADIAAEAGYCVRLALKGGAK